MVTLEKDKNSLLTSEIELIELERAKAELTNYKAEEEGRKTREKKAFLELEEFFNLLGSRAAIMFEYCFDKVVQQFKEVAYPPKGITFDFLNLSRALNNLPEKTFGSE